jgi:amino acid transporter
MALVGSAQLEGTSTEEITDVGPGSTVVGLDEKELAVLRRVGGHWGQALGPRRAWTRALPIDPGLHRFPDSLEAGRGRFAPVDFVETGDAGEIEATSHAGAGNSWLGHAASSWRRVVLGAPLAGSAVVHERMRKPVGLAILSSDALSSVAYGPEAMLAVLALAGAGALGLSLWISVAIVVLMIAVGLSYRQLIRAYPHGGGSYVVADKNLGELPALVAAGGLMIDYVLTVAVSVSAGVAAITSAIPGLAQDAVPLGLAAIAILLAGNLRGVRQAGAIFSAPTYAFALAVFALIVVGLADASTRGFAPTEPAAIAPIQGLTLLLVLRAFSSGATAMTGIEAISNAVPAFEPPAPRNARKVLTLMIVLLVSMFVGLVLLMHLNYIVPRSGETALSQLAHRSFGTGPLYAYVQVATALVLLLAANTAFNGFPRLLSFMARNGHAPRLCLRLGDRLAFSNGTIALAVAAGVLFAGFGGRTEALIPLYAVGVFVAFTLSQAGMVVHWWRRRERHWRKSIVLNGVGAVLSGIVFVIAAVTKFSHGAWVALLLIALLVLVAWHIRSHYESVRSAVALYPLEAPASHDPIVPAHLRVADFAAQPMPNAEHDESPDQLQHLTVVPIVRLDLSGLRALAYAASLGQPVLAVHISPDSGEAARFKSDWAAWGDHLPLEVVDSPYRAVVAPLVCYIDALRTQRSELTLTVAMPELIVKHRWHRPLHNGTARRLRRALRRQPGVVITTVPLHLPT